MAAHTLEHTGAAIVEDYYPTYATERIVVTPLYSGEIFLGSALILLSMCTLGLPITALGYHLYNDSVDLTWVWIALSVTVVVFAVGMAVTVSGFRKHKRRRSDFVHQ